PINIPITTGTQFYVTLEFANPTDVGGGGPSVIRDTNGCQSGKNVIFASPPGMWFNACSLGIAGDFVIRAVINCQSTGACCRAGGCLATTAANCAAIGGVFAGAGTTCSGGICTAGACCNALGGCTQRFGFQCTAAGGTFQGPGTNCSPNPCPPPLGACCYGDFCIPDQPEADCTGTGGVWAGALTTCGPPNPCISDACSGVNFTPGDINGSGSINGADVQAFVSQYISPTSGSVAFCAADMCPDRVIDNSDLSAFVACLLDPTTCSNPNCP
ncbi:MAG TPA: dockerin type I repeat-containing protein, partial [Phycisphaerae bacterium]|nr:dockerin type I repeat-containing protein [Phycisphaerae bacterium]